MAKPSDVVSWTGFNTVLTLMLGIAIAVVGGGFAWLHSDMADIRTDVREIRSRVQDSREEVLRAMNRLESQASVANVKLEELANATRKGR